jgi:peptidoglycan/xylan/chitin deacetylase (PgdA/CDA1 family)
VLALTWDDGPDVHTLELASYLKKRNISATFFVVESWKRDLSDDPGEGTGVFESGHAFEPILGDLVALGHRVANHTLHHVHLREARGRDVVDEELRKNQEVLDRFITNEVRFFRVPGGTWGPFPADVVDHDPYLTQLVGPFGWDIDRKDWDASVSCDSTNAARECDSAGPNGGRRTKPEIVAARYLETTERVGRGIVLLHDRVGHVGSSYALELARKLVPSLEAQGFVFAGPTLRFGPFARRDEPGGTPSAFWGDVDADGRADLCSRADTLIRCARSTTRVDGGLARAQFHGDDFRVSLPLEGDLHIADVDGDGRADACVTSSRGILCSLVTANGGRPTESWSTESFIETQFGDVDGDGKADACTRRGGEVRCARSLGHTFGPTQLWLPNEGSSVDGTNDATEFLLADVDGDARVDACFARAGVLRCGLSSGHSFGPRSRVGPAVDNEQTSIFMGDLNGDKRADVCRASPRGITCALATPKGFANATTWVTATDVGVHGWNRSDLARTLKLADINGDGRSDLCGKDAAGGLVCAIAP